MLGDTLLRGERVYLDAVDREDMQVVGPWWRSLTLQQFVSPGIMRPMTMEDELGWFESTRKNADVMLFAIRLVDGNEIIGTTTLGDFDHRCRKCGFGIAIGDQTAWGKGYGSEATALAVRYGFLELNLHRIQLAVYAYNERAVRAYTKVGFTVEGTLRDSMYRYGRYWDEYIMAILRRDWDTGEDAAKVLGA